MIIELFPLKAPTQSDLESWIKNTHLKSFQNQFNILKLIAPKIPQKQFPTPLPQKPPPPQTKTKKNKEKPKEKTKNKYKNSPALPTLLPPAPVLAENTAAPETGPWLPWLEVRLV